MKPTLPIPLLVVILIVPGCASIDFNYPRTQSFFLEGTQNTYLAREVEEAADHRLEGQSGFYLLLDGIDALAARLLLIEHAEKSIDVQYYLIKDDIVGNLFIRALLRAADRGVRVRVLLDDIFTKGYDAGMSAMHSHPNIEIRIFNPFRRGFLGRSVGAALDFARVNRRMHNKSFTADNQVTLIGGRNIADEYFGAREDAQFGDLDVVGIGPVVGEVSAMFDDYWNHETALPVPALLPELNDPEAELARVRLNLDTAYADAKTSRYASALRQRVLSFIDSESVEFQWIPYQLIYDSPDKGIRQRSKTASSITEPLAAALLAAESEIVVISPYFVPRKSGVETLVELRSRGVEISVVTNSLAANNQFAVHGGYAPARKALLRHGIRIYEVRPDAKVAGAELVAGSGAKATLHTKAFLVDRSRLFVGSFNFDPRSANINTELGVILESERFGNQLAERLSDLLPTQTYTLFLDETAEVRWQTFDDGRAVVYEREPQTTWSQRVAAGFMRILPIRGQL